MLTESGRKRERKGDSVVEHAGLVLIVDDNRDFSDAVASYLEANDFIVFNAYNDREGLTLARRERPDLIIFGAAMATGTPGSLPIGEFRRLPELGDVPILVLGSIYTDDADLSVPPGRDWRSHAECLTRPLDMPRLLHKVRERLAAGIPAADRPESPQES